MKKIIIVDDHLLVCQGIAQLVDRIPDFEVISTYTDPCEALQKIKILQPDLLLVDLEMPKLNGLELVERLRQEGTSIKVILLTMHFNQSVIKKAIDMKIDGYLPKQAEVKEFRACLDTVFNGDIYFSNKAREILAKPTQKIEKTGLKKTQSLTKREREILRLIAQGEPTKSIADQLNIAKSTVDSHRKAILEKLAVSNMAGMVRIAVQEGVV
ncbi:MAG: response regulator transcription factor [Bacteroidota bacterium]